VTDEETFRRVFGRSDWAVMFILARGGRSHARLSFHVGPQAEVKIPVDVDYTRPFSGCEPDRWEREYLASVFPESSPGKTPHRPDIESSLHEEPTDEWYEGWFDYTEQYHSKGSVS
jgi:hypothetical protein